MISRRILGAVVLLVVPSGATRQAPAVPVTLAPEFVTIRPATVFRVVVWIAVPDGWHISWKYPGQSGLATVLDWRVSPGVSFDSTAWPFPERTDSSGVVAHVYRGAVLLVSFFHVSGDAPIGAANLVAEVRWGLCREICIPQEQRVRVSLPVGSRVPEASPGWPLLTDVLVERLPVNPRVVDLEVRRVPEGIQLAPVRARRRSAPSVGTVVFFPEDPDRAAVARVVHPHPTPVGLLIPLPIPHAAPLRGVLVTSQSWGAEGGPPARALRIDLAR